MKNVRSYTSSKKRKAKSVLPRKSKVRKTVLTDNMARREKERVDEDEDDEDEDEDKDEEEEGGE